jgi:hypothetical protein
LGLRLRIGRVTVDGKAVLGTIELNELAFGSELLDSPA